MVWLARLGRKLTLVVPCLGSGLHRRTALGLLVCVQVVADLRARLLLVAGLVVVHLLLVLAVHLLLD